jgi:hypothetical protein
MVGAVERTGMSVPKLQHYVPQFLLREFARGKSSHIHVFDKRTGRVFVTNTKNAAAENRFYDLDDGRSTVSLEPVMTSVESAVAPVLRRVVTEESLAWISPRDRAKIALFVGLQLTRTRNFRGRINQTQATLAEKLRGMGVDPAAVPGYTEPSDGSAARVQARIAIAADELAPFVADKTWMLLRNDTAQPFFTSDNPVAMQNHQLRDERGSLGLGVRGIEINLPLSPHLVLCMLCPSYLEGMRASVAHVAALRRTGLLPPAHEVNARQLEEFVRQLEAGAPIEQLPENVTNVNSLQVRSSERYLYCSADAFDLAREMLRKHPSLAESGPRMASG